MSEITITDEQRGDMLHALGLPEYPVHAPLPKRRSQRAHIYRNYYTCAADSDSGRSWQDLIDKGLAVGRQLRTCSDYCYFVTMAGVEFLGVKRFIDPRCDVKFG